MVSGNGRTGFSKHHNNALPSKQSKSKKQHQKEVSAVVKQGEAAAGGAVKPYSTFTGNKFDQVRNLTMYVNMHVFCGTIVIRGQFSFLVSKVMQDFVYRFKKVQYFPARNEAERRWWDGGPEL